MRFNRVTQTLLLLGAVAFAGPTLAQEQTQQQGPMGPGMMMGRQMMGQDMGMDGQMNMGMMMGGGCPMMGMMGGSMDTHMEGRLAFLKAEIEITESQTKAWDAFAEAMRANAKSMADMRTDMTKLMKQGKPSATQMLDMHTAMMENRLAALKEFKPALDTLYEGLSSDQRAKADQLIPSVGCLM